MAVRPEALAVVDEAAAAYVKLRDAKGGARADDIRQAIAGGG